MTNYGKAKKAEPPLTTNDRVLLVSTDLTTAITAYDIF